jgi:RNA polymerase sigma-70 factor (ECF subfamily)
MAATGVCSTPASGNSRRAMWTTGALAERNRTLSRSKHIGQAGESSVAAQGPGYGALRVLEVRRRITDSWRRTQARLRRRAMRYLKDDDDVDDIIQETWLRAHASAPSYAGRGSLEGWLLRVCDRVCLMELRSRARSRQREAQVAVTMNASASEEALLVERLQSAVENQHLADVALDALMSLAPRQRHVAILRFMLGRSIDEVAAALDIAPGTVKAVSHHARRRLRLAMTTLMKAEDTVLITANDRCPMAECRVGLLQSTLGETRHCTYVRTRGQASIDASRVRSQH